MKEIFDQIQTKHTNFEEEGVEALKNEMEGILIKNERENEDLQNLSKALGQYIHVSVDMKSLGVLDHNLQQVTNTSISDADYLHKSRCQAESRLIKTKILYKIDKHIKLSQSERKYLAAWKKAMANSKTLIEDCLVPKYSSKLNISNLADADIKALNQVPLVQLDK